MVDGMICGMRLSSFGGFKLISTTGTVPQGLGLRCFRQSPCPDFDVFEHLITHPMNVDWKWLGIGKWPQLLGGFKYTIVLCPTIEIGWTSPIIIYYFCVVFCRAAETTFSLATHISYSSRRNLKDHGHMGGPCLCKALCRSCPGLDGFHRRELEWTLRTTYVSDTTSFLHIWHMCICACT